MNGIETTVEAFRALLAGNAEIEYSHPIRGWVPFAPNEPVYLGPWTRLRIKEAKGDAQ